MKVGILTFHRTPNFGAVLQAYALQNVLRSLGVENEIIDYRNRRIEQIQRPLYFYHFKNPLNYLKYRYNKNNNTRKYEKFAQFRREFLNVSKIVYNHGELKQPLNLLYDKYICGSDQVWNYSITNYDTTYLLDFESNSEKKISYAASFGVTRLEKDIEPIYVNLLQQIKFLSVREAEGQNIIRNICHRETIAVLDPTLLLNKSNWNDMIKSDLINSLDEKKYVLCYELEISEEMQIFSRSIAKIKNLEVIRISHNKDIIRKNNDKVINDIGPLEFLKLFSNAEFVVTNSFHGTAFSIIYEKPFVTFLLEKHAEVNSRLVNIINLLELDERVFRGKNANYYLNHAIDYSNVNNNLENCKVHSYAFLKSALNLV